jgi:hypothetical protein
MSQYSFDHNFTVKEHASFCVAWAGETCSPQSQQRPHARMLMEQNSKSPELRRNGCCPRFSRYIDVESHSSRHHPVLARDSANYDFNHLFIFTSSWDHCTAKFRTVNSSDRFEKWTLNLWFREQTSSLIQKEEKTGKRKCQPQTENESPVPSSTVSPIPYLKDVSAWPKETAW